MTTSALQFGPNRSRLQPGTYRCAPISVALDYNGRGAPRAVVLLRREDTEAVLRKVIPLDHQLVELADEQLAPLGVTAARVLAERYISFPEDARVDAIVQCRNAGGGPYVAACGTRITSPVGDHLDLDRLVGDKYVLSWEEPVEGRNRHPGVSGDNLWWYRRIEGKHGHIGCWSKHELYAYCHGRKAHARLLAIPGVVVKQCGDHEFNATFPLDCLDKVAAILQVRKCRTPMSPEDKDRLVAVGRSTRLRRKADDHGAKRRFAGLESPLGVGSMIHPPEAFACVLGAGMGLLPPSRWVGLGGIWSARGAASRCAQN